MRREELDAFWKGDRVRLLTDMETRGHIRFDVGEVVFVQGTTVNGLRLRAEDGRRIIHVDPDDVELLDRLYLYGSV